MHVLSGLGSLYSETCQSGLIRVRCEVSMSVVLRKEADPPWVLESVPVRARTGAGARERVASFQG